MLRENIIFVFASFFKIRFLVHSLFELVPAARFAFFGLVPACALAFLLHHSFFFIFVLLFVLLLYFCLFCFVLFSFLFCFVLSSDTQNDLSMRPCVDDYTSAWMEDHMKEAYQEGEMITFRTDIILSL